MLYILESLLLLLTNIWRFGGTAQTNASA